MANSLDPDETAPKQQSKLGLHCLLMHFSTNIEGRYEIPGHQSMNDCLINIYNNHIAVSFLTMIVRKLTLQCNTI